MAGSACSCASSATTPSASPRRPRSRRPAPSADRPIEALTVALDFRSDRLVVFSLQGSLYARELPGKGAPHALQRLGPSPPAGARIAAVLSDDDRAIIAWTVRHDGQTSVYVSHSQPGVRFTEPQLLEEFPDPPGLPGYVDSPQLVRLSSESVMLAWTGAVAGHWAIRAAAIDQRGVLPPSTISPAGRDALLAGLARRTERRGARAVERTAAHRRGPGPRRAGDLRRARVRRLSRTGQVRRPRTARPAGAEQRRDRRLRSGQRPCGRGLAHGHGALAYAVRAPGAP